MPVLAMTRASSKASCLPSSLVEPRLVVVGIDVADAALHEQEDDPLGLRGEVRRLRGERVGGRGLVRSSRPGEGEGAEPAAGAGEPFAAGDGRAWPVFRRAGSSLRGPPVESLATHRSGPRRLGAARANQSTYRKSADANSAWNTAAHASFGSSASLPGTSAATCRSPSVGGGRAPAGTPASTRASSSASPRASSRAAAWFACSDDERVVHQEQRLRGDGAGVPPAGDHARVGEVERLEQLRQRVAEHRQVDAAAVAVVLVAVVGREVAGKVGPPRSAVEVAARRPASRRGCTRPPAAGGSPGRTAGSPGPRRLPIASPVADWRYVRLSTIDRTSFLTDQPSCDELGWRGGRAIRGGTASSPVVPKLSTVRTIPSPNSQCQARLAIHPGGQRVVLRGDPVGEFLAAALALRDRRRRAAGGDLEEAPRGRLAEVVDAAADVDPRVLDHLLLDHRHRHRPLRPASPGVASARPPGGATPSSAGRLRAGLRRRRRPG